MQELIFAALVSGAAMEESRAPRLSLPALLQEETPEREVLEWIEFTFNIGIEAMGDGEMAEDNVLYSDAYNEAVVWEGQLAKAYGWVTSWGFFSDVVVRPHVGYQYREYDAEPVAAEDAFGNPLTLTFDDLRIQTVYAGVTVGVGRIPEGNEGGMLLYFTFQVGGAHVNEVEVRENGGPEEPFLEDGWNLYFGVGMGLEVLFSNLSLRLEGGVRGFGIPDDAGGSLIPGDDVITAGYLLVGISIAR